LKIAPDDCATPYERAAQIIKMLPEAKASIYTIVSLYAAEQYGPPSMPFQRLHQNIEAHQAWRAARSIVLKRLVRRLNVFEPQAR
jgi:hypothetical protein